MRQAFFGHSKESQEAALQSINKYLSETDHREILEEVAYIEGMRYLSLDMKRELLKNFNSEDLAMAFKFSSRKLIGEFFEGLSKSIKQEILYGLQQKCSIGEFKNNLDKLVRHMKLKESKGELILSKELNETYV
ncbi:MAG: hypothetical protein H6622_16410 [Halobacteriovoraceae bacterium]|nr:hypothetical protein [Halobacteriovoraceae bacterium]